MTSVLEDSQRLYDGARLESITLLNNFIILLWQTDKSLVDLFSGKSLIERGLELPLDCRCGFFVPYRASLLTAAALIQGLLNPSHSISVQSLMFKIATGPPDLTYACECPGRSDPSNDTTHSPAALAFYIVKNPHISSLAVLFMTMDYLRNTLSTILSGRHYYEEETLALIVAPIVCLGLLKLSRYNMELSGSSLFCWSKYSDLSHGF